MTNGSITDRYALYTLIVRVLHALYWKVGRENKRKQIGTLQHIALRISDLQKQNLRSQQRLKLCSCIVFISDYQCIRCSASVNKANHISIMHWHIYYEAFSRYNIVCAELNPAFGLVTQIGQ